MPSRRVFKSIALFGMLILLGMSAVFVCRAIGYAQEKNFWVDETYGLEGTVRSDDYWQLLFWGARGQGSAAPLDYIFIKIWDQAYHHFSHLRGIPANIYYRLNSILWDLMAGIFISVLFLFVAFRERRSVVVGIFQVGLLVLALSTFYFKSNNFHFAAEMRPYALWNSLWFVLLGLVMVRAPSWGIACAGILLALTSSGALIQIPALAVSWMLVRLLDKEPPKEVLRDVVVLFLVPVFIAVFYASHADKFGYVSSASDYDRYSAEFFSFWKSKWRVPLLAIAGFLLAAGSCRWRSGMIVFGGILLLYWGAPFINHKILSSGFFFTSRQYLYYDLVFPFFYLMLVLVLPEYFDRLRNVLSLYFD